jgi:hypothetical protein
VNQTTKAIPAPNARSNRNRNRIRPSPDLDTPGRTKDEASVRSLVVVVPHVLVTNPLKMTSTAALRRLGVMQRTPTSETAAVPRQGRLQRASEELPLQDADA